MQLNLDIVLIKMDMPHLSQKKKIFIRQTLILESILSPWTGSSPKPSKILGKGFYPNSYFPYKGAVSI